MKYLRAWIILAIVFNTVCIFSQTRPSLQFSAGLAFPGQDFAGELVTVTESGISFINSDFIKKNYAASTGASVTGTLKFPIGQKGILRAILTGSYTYFNAFKGSALGTTIENNIIVPVTFDNRFSTSSFGMGIETSPFSNSKFSPYAGGSFTLNILSLSLSRNDFISIIFNDAFRMGLLLNAGIDYKLSDEYSLTLGGSYHMSNLFFRTHKESFADRIEFNRESVPINDEEGSFYSNLSDPDSAPVVVKGSTKNVSWLNINIGLNIMLGKSNKK